MESHVINTFLGFIEGFGLIISPCILPILPVFLAASLNGEKNRLWGMMIGFTVFFTVLIFFSRQLVNSLGFNFNIIRNAGYIILLIAGAIMSSNYLTEKFSQMTQGLVRFTTFFSSNKKLSGGFFNGLLWGGLIAIIWTPCAGPILAAIIVQTVTQRTTPESFLILFAFAVGAVIPLLIISLYGKKITGSFTFFKKHGVAFRKFLGIAISTSVIYMMYFEGKVVLPAVTSTGIKTSVSLINGLWAPYPAPPIEGITTWINSSPLHLNDLKGKVVLIDFWTYSCINCLRTLPYVTFWHNQYHDKGLVIIGVHTPEFDFEKNSDNVKKAVTRHNISYPVALDNQFTTWTNFNNHYWPAHYLINRNEEVVYQHFGEGDYEITENNIRFLLGINQLIENIPENKWAMRSQTPEIYLGYERADIKLSPNLIKNKSFNYRFSSSLALNSWDLRGLWQVHADHISAEEAHAALKIHFKARQVFMVMGSATKKIIKVKIRLNGLPEYELLVDKYFLYKIVSQKEFSEGDLELTATESGVEIYTITFGS